MGGAVIQMFVKTPAAERFPNLHPHGALNQANTISSFIPITIYVCMIFLDEEKNGYVVRDQLLNALNSEGLDMPGVSDLASA